MTKKSLTVKNMINEYYNARSDMDTVWDTFNCMRMMGFITNDEWLKFFNKCQHWCWDSERKCVIEFGTDAEVKL